MTSSPIDRTTTRTRRAPALLGGLALVAAIVLGACGDGEPTSSGAPEETTTSTTSTPSTTGDDGTVTTGAPGETGSTVEIERSRFAPRELEVAVGATVTFENLDGYDHTVTSRDDSALQFDSGPFGDDEPFSQTFDEAGSYAYFCEIHPTMRATVVVG